MSSQSNQSIQSSEAYAVNETGDGPIETLGL